MCRYFGSLEYDWQGLSKQPTVLAKARRSFAQLGPAQYDTFHWRAFSSPLRCLQCLGPLAVILLCEVSELGRYFKAASLGVSWCHRQRLCTARAADGAWGPSRHFAV